MSVRFWHPLMCLIDRLALAGKLRPCTHGQRGCKVGLGPAELHINRIRHHATELAVATRRTTQRIERRLQFGPAERFHDWEGDVRIALRVVALLCWAKQRSLGLFAWLAG